MQRFVVGQRMKHQENVSFRLKTLCLGQKNSEKNICFPLKKLFFLPSVEKTTIFSSGNKSSPQSFSVPGIMIPPRRNIQTSTPSKYQNQFYKEIKRQSSFFCIGARINYMARGLFPRFCSKFQEDVVLLRNYIQGVLALCEFHYCEFHYCGFSKLLLKFG